MKKCFVVIPLLYSALIQAGCLPGAPDVTVPPSQRGETRYLFPLDGCSKLDSDSRLVIERDAAISKLFWDYRTGAGQAPVWLRLTAWNIKKDGVMAAQGHYWGPEVQFSSKLGLRVGLMMPTSDNQKPSLAATMAWGY